MPFNSKCWFSTHVRHDENNIYSAVLDEGPIKIQMYGSQPRSVSFNNSRTTNISLITSGHEKQESQSSINNGRDSAAPYPWIMGILILCGCGFYFIRNGVYADFNAAKIGFGLVCFVSGLFLLLAGIIHGDLVPSWLAVSERGALKCRIIALIS